MTAKKERERPRVALLHVADRTGIVEFAHDLLALGFNRRLANHRVLAGRYVAGKNVAAGKRAGREALVIMMATGDRNPLHMCARSRRLFGYAG